METYFAPARRTDPDTLNEQINQVSQSPVMTSLLNVMPGLLVVLNEGRQIVALNSEFLRTVGITDPYKALGMRLGETLACVHAHAEPAGCGTTAHCVTCGAAIAMMTAINEDKADQQICSLTADRDGTIKDVSLMIKAQPVKIEDYRFVLIFASDVTQQQFWTNLERVFFHDISNTITSLFGNAYLLEQKIPDQPELQQIMKAVERLWGEVSFQKSLSRHKDSPYLIKKTRTSLTKIQDELEMIVTGHQALKNKNLLQNWPEHDHEMETDPLLVSRILGNMVINALEATPENGSVIVNADWRAGRVTFEVWSETFIPEDIQKRIFQRHFSTKGDFGRGLGTYSMKLFGEKYLNGRVSFKSTRDNGTVFTFCMPA
ncbi:MAG: sensor histidine kinase [Desulfobacteraceae bacterium]|nr:MAG: sensor histidine kinase [Desulfobacteraceae bacterium]